MHAAQVGFYSAVPEKWKESRGARMGWNIPLPVIKAGGYLLQIISDIGYTMPTVAGGHRPLNDSDLWHYSMNRDELEEPWEFETVIGMSRAYVSGFNSGLDELSLSPMEIEDEK